MYDILRKTTNGIEHGQLKTLVNQVSKAEAYKKLDAKRKTELEARIKSNSEPLKVRYVHYKNQETGHRCADYTAGPGEPMYIFKFLHNEVYTIPRGLKDLINSDRSKRPKREGSLDDSTGAPIAKDGPARRIDEFVPVNF